MNGTENGAAELERLAAELDSDIFDAHVVAPSGRRPRLHVRNRQAGMLAENIYAGDGYFWWGWAERIAAADDLLAAAEAVARVLGAAGGGR